MPDLILRQDLDYAELKFLQRNETDPPGFEPGSEAPEASILSRLYYESTYVKWMRKTMK